MLHKYT